MDLKNVTLNKSKCFHCGDDCTDEHIHIEKKIFCCDGCKMVYEILNKNNLCEYYDIEANPGLNQKVKVREGKFAFLENETVQQKLIHFDCICDCNESILNEMIC